MKILITGASGYVGAKLYVDIKQVHEVIGTYFTKKLFEELIQLDITNRENVTSIISEVKPDIIIHVAANPDPRWCEKNSEEAIKINQTSTEFIVDAANTVGAKILFISSYAVINNSSVYAKTKSASESIVKNTTSGFIIIRPAHIVGYSPNTENDRQYNRFLKNLKDQVPAVYDTSWRFQATYLRHISEVILRIIELHISNQIIPVAVPELTTRFDLAKDILSPFGIQVTGENQNNHAPQFFEDVSILHKLHLPEYSYTEMITNILQETRDNLKL